MRRHFLYAALLYLGTLSAQVGQKEILVYFDSGSHVISAEGASTLNALFVTDSLTINSVSVEGFCDDIGTEYDNLALSRKRAESVAEYIRTHAAIHDLSATGKGEIALNSAADALSQRQHNRRVAVVASYAVAPEEPKPVRSQPAAVDLFEGYKMPGENLSEGDKLILRQLVFVASTTVFEDAEACETELSRYVQYFKANPGINFEIHGHVCCISKSFFDARNIYTGKNNLSEDRAKRIYDYFIEKGIDKSRMAYKGFGRKFPRPGVAEKFNKRVEIVITKL
ncbi:hypothetical protein HYN48_04215 [Flavobacterium magnum]|uniref:OmpA-like domain-containing protein n=1 Tax=Flavobacterium magnum TaxID=2162713 RepID=A0A2S0RCJ7_9FLAO|nr:OmpA family protein [Flavobacterium magnum]AWA29354.1 hypothetical protein HYN48_04215 [Flavobacterium magnum]